MTPKDKANKLCMTFLMETDIPSKAIAKKCALICVDEILDAVTTIADKKFDFYTEVKKEIEKL